MFGENKTTTPLPAVFSDLIQPDIVQFVHTSMAEEKQARTTSFVSLVSEGGTSQSGQGAFGNMWRDGKMSAPTKRWRRWHHKINTTQKRYVVASALVPWAVPALVMARGHCINEIPEIPLVLKNKLENTKITS